MNMDCENVVKNFFDYLDKELCSEDREGLEAHLNKCRGCFDAADFEKRLFEHLRQKTSHRCPEELKQKIKNIIDKF